MPSNSSFPGQGFLYGAFFSSFVWSAISAVSRLPDSILERHATQQVTAFSISLPACSNPTHHLRSRSPPCWLHSAKLAAPSPVAHSEQHYNRHQRSKHHPATSVPSEPTAQDCKATGGARLVHGPIHTPHTTRFRPGWATPVGCSTMQRLVSVRMAAPRRWLYYPRPPPVSSFRLFSKFSMRLATACSPVLPLPST